MRLYLDPISVRAAGKRPQTISWNGREIHVRRILNYWVSQDTWWGREEKRVYMLLLTTHGTLEVYRSGEQWTLSRLSD